MSDLLFVADLASTTPQYVSAYDQARMLGIVVGAAFMTAAMLLRWETKTGLPASFLFVFSVVGLALIGIAHRAVLPPSRVGAFVLLLSFTAFAITGAVVLALSLSAGIHNDE